MERVATVRLDFRAGFYSHQPGAGFGPDKLLAIPGGEQRCLVIWDQGYPGARPFDYRNYRYDRGGAAGSADAGRRAGQWA